MAVETGVTPSLELAAPKVGVTEHEPVNQSSSTIPAECISDVDRKPLDKTSEVVTAVTTPVPEPVAGELNRDSNVDNNPKQQGSQSAGCSSDLATDQLNKDSNIKHSTGQESGPSGACIPESVAESESVVHQEVVTQDNEQDDTFRSSSGFCAAFRRFGYRYLEMTKSSKNCCCLYLVLMALPVAVVVIGVLYLHECKMSPAVPYLMCVIGILATLLLACRIVVARLERRFSMNVFTVILFVITLVLFSLEMMAFWRFSPSFDETSPKFCNTTFYSFTYYINCVTVCFMVILIPTLIGKWLISGRNAD